MAKVTVRMGIEVDGLAVHLVDHKECDNPLLYATAAKCLADALEKKINKMVAGTFGDARRIDSVEEEDI